MKTAISIPDPIFKAADGFAHRMGISRSELYAKAISEYLKNHRDNGVTEKLNEVYSEESSQLDDELRTMQSRSISDEPW